MAITLSPDLILPSDAVTQKFAFLARSGAGKTYAAGKLVEELTAALAQVVVVDPVGVWWGLRLAKDGKSDGLKNFYIFGGQHGDLPLEPTAGNLIADALTDHGISAVLDVSDLTGGEQRRFVADFATHLLQRKRNVRSPMMVVWEECQDFVPQRVMHDAARMVGAMERLIKQGRNCGIGTTLISQRPQAVNKDVLNQTECLVVLQMTGPQERKTIQGWVVENGAQVEDAVNKLPSLARGEAFVWSPQWLKTFKQVKIAKKWTYDASSTPGAHSENEAKKLPTVNLDKLRTAMADTVERAKQEDPKALRIEVARLKKELDTALKSVPTPKTKIVEVPVLSDAFVKRIEAHFEKTGKLVADLKALGDAFAKVKLYNVEPPRMAFTVQKANGALVDMSKAKAWVAVKTPAPASPPSSDGTRLNRGAREMLVQLCKMNLLTRAQLATLAGMSPTSGTFSNYLGDLRRLGYIKQDGSSFIATATGRNFIGPVDPAPATTEALVSMWEQRFNAGARKMLRVLVASYPNAIEREQLASAVEMSATSGTFSNYLGDLNRNGLIQKNRDGISASTALFMAQ